MLAVLRNTWALMVGMFMLQVGNGMQGSVLGVRGGIEGFDATVMGFVMSGYFLGFLGGAQLTPVLLRRVGHVRVFAALASMISAAFIIYGAIIDPSAWFVMRFLTGFCFSGVYVVAESWLNNQADNENRGKTLSAYLIVQMMGIILAQSLLNVADPGGYDLFVIMSVAVSVSFAPILLTASPTPVFETTRRMSLINLFRASPLGCVGTFFLGGIFACLFGMASVYGTEVGMTTAEISIFVGSIYAGGLVLQFPIGWISDRMDRRKLIAIVTALGTFAAVVAVLSGGNFVLLTAAAFVVGGTANPLYSLIIAHTNDFLEREDMAAASGGLIVLNGVGASGTPVLVGYLMGIFGSAAFPVFVALLMAAISLYAVYRMTVRPARSAEETLPVAPIALTTTAVNAEFAQEYIVEQAMAAEEEQRGAESETAA